MIGDKQEQSVNNQSTALQANRDIILNYGIQPDQIKELCILFLKENFPILREEAKLAAQQHVQNFALILEKKITNDAKFIVLEKFADPDVQAAINDAVQACARKGLNANPAILSSLISERIAIVSNDYKNLVLCEAINVVPKLTGPQIAFISLTHLIRYVDFQNITSISELEPIGKKAISCFSAGLGISSSQRQHIEYSGACSINYLHAENSFGRFMATYGKRFNLHDTSSAKVKLSSQAPSFTELLKFAANENLDAINLTSVGQAIAIASISNYNIFKPDYSIWLK